MRGDSTSADADVFKHPQGMWMPVDIDRVSIAADSRPHTFLLSFCGDSEMVGVSGMRNLRASSGGTRLWAQPSRFAPRVRG
jgi:hypothetical protein